METFSALLALCVGNSPASGEFPAQRPVTRSFDVFFDLCLIKRLSKHSRSWWFETLSRPLWRHCNVLCITLPVYMSCVISQSIHFHFIAAKVKSSSDWNYSSKKQTRTMTAFWRCVNSPVPSGALVTTAAMMKYGWVAEQPWQQGLWGQHGAHLGPTGPRWAPCWPHEICYLGEQLGLDSA